MVEDLRQSEIQWLANKQSVLRTLIVARVENTCYTIGGTHNSSTYSTFWPNYF